ncbi:pyridoxal phosphate-dependent aminotransferase [Xinfangfangia sp. CPCC 101601]|uniref:aspartate transaminase n=1 Tax=Pseudogemmobacter lacusdianii TaxID=3069608 RepID=A0ABU0VYX0_9RHOB|nr:pyridoxal phosphate-dependent aminotransferase [Xinfangfangia sp. CPCC 101601]MDQ2066105.1 pyridoxal phosphate-dependent aminotransferase [Xinfangfangia sp. CPCC 101601]
MRFADVTDRLAGLGSEKWEVHTLARAAKAEGRAVIELTIGEPDAPTPPELITEAGRAMSAGRTGYSNGRGEPALVTALARRYSARRGRTITADQVICLPGTQTSLYATLRTLLQAGDEVIVGDPMYATYEGLIAQTGAKMVPVPLRPENGFRMAAADVEAQITPRTRVLFLNSPHNPTGAVLRPEDIRALGAVAQKHDLWILADEVYEELVFPGVTFTSPLDFPELAERVIVACSISKSHAAPGFRSGWVIGPEEFTSRLLPLSETMLFGSQPFISDMTALAVSSPSPIAPGMAARFAARAEMLVQALDGKQGLRVHKPEAGMFALVDIRATSLSGRDFALSLLDKHDVAVMPGESFGEGLRGWLRLSLTVEDGLITRAAERILSHAATLQGKAA